MTGFLFTGLFIRASSFAHLILLSNIFFMTIRQYGRTMKIVYLNNYQTGINVFWITNHSHEGGNTILIRSKYKIQIISQQRCRSRKTRRKFIPCVIVISSASQGLSTYVISPNIWQGLCIQYFVQSLQ